MQFVALQGAAGGGQIEQIAATFGVDWPHLIAQIISFGIVCAVLYFAAYTPILRTLEARRQQIAAGLANAEKIKAELARIEAGRQEVLRMAAAEGEVVVPPGILAQMLAEGAEKKDARPKVTEELTPVELEVLQLVSQGLTNREIAERLRWSVGNVKKYVQRILDKLAVSDRTQAAVEAVRRGLVRPPA